MSSCVAEENVTVYEVWVNEDQTEGRGRDFVIGAYLTHDLAVKAAKGKNVMGSNGDIRTRQTDVIYLNGYSYLLGPRAYASQADVDQDIEKKRRESALAKLAKAGLSDAELAALGIKAT